MADKFILNEDFDIPGADEAADVLGYDPDAEPTLEDQGWEYVASKDVYDEDGFRDSYMWYRKDGNNRFFFSSDADYGDPEYFDWETEGDEAAQEWFDSYGEDEDDLTFVDNREATILGKGDDPGFDEYDRVDEAKRKGINVGDYVRVRRNKNLPDFKGKVEKIDDITNTYVIRLENEDAEVTVPKTSVLISKIDLDEAVEDKDGGKVKVHYYAKNVDAIAEETFDYDYFVDNKDKILSSYDDVVDVQVFDKDGYYLHDINEAVEDNLTAKAEIETPRGDFCVYKGTWKDFENEDDRDDWGFWFDHYTDDNKHFKIMHNHIDNSAIAVLKEGLNESKRGFVEKYRGYSIHDAGDRYVITDEKGLNVGETRFGIPVCRGMIDDMIDGKEADKITEAKRTKFPRGFNLGSSNNQNVKVRNPYNYTIQELSINNKAKTFERGNFSMGRADIELKNRQEYEDIVDLLKDQGYTEVKSDYHSLRNKTRKGIREDKQTDMVGKEEARKVFDKGGQVYISNGGKNYWGYDKSSGKTLDDVIKNYYDNQKNLSFMVDHRPLTKDHLLDRIKERRKTVEEEFTEDLDSNSVVGKDYSEIKKKLYRNGYREDKKNFFVEDGKSVYTWWKNKRDFINVFVEDGIIVQVSGKLYLKESFEGEKGTTNNSVANRLITAINDEWKTIDLYNSIISELSMIDGDDYKKMIPVIEDIVNEENVHVGQLQKALELISPDTVDIAKGEKEAEGQISGGDPADDKKALVDESCGKSVEENPDDDIEGTEWYPTDIKEIPYGKNNKRIKNRKLVDIDKEPVRNPVNEGLEDSKENATLIRTALASGSLDRDAFIDYVLTNTPDEMLSGAVNFIGTSNFDTEDDLDFLGDGVDVTDSFVDDLFIDEDTLEDGSVITLKDYSKGDTTALQDGDNSTITTVQNDSEPACDDCDDLPDGVDITLVDVDDDKPLEEEKPLQEMGPLAATLLTAVAPVVADKVMDKVLPEEKEDENKVDDEVYGNADDDDVDIKGI